MNTRPRTPPINNSFFDNSSLSTPERTGVVRTVYTPNTITTPERTLDIRRGRHYGNRNIRPFPNFQDQEQRTHRTRRTHRTPQAELLNYYIGIFDRYYQNQHIVSGTAKTIAVIDQFNTHFINNFTYHIHLFPQPEDAIDFYNHIYGQLANNSFPYNNEINIDHAIESGRIQINNFYNNRNSGGKKHKKYNKSKKTTTIRRKKRKTNKRKSNRRKSNKRNK